MSHASAPNPVEPIDERLIAINQPGESSASFEDLQEFFRERAGDLPRTLRSDVDFARRALAKHFEKLVLTPKETHDGLVFLVSGNVELS